MSVEAMSGVLLRAADLHGSVTDPGMESMNFLNEVVGRFPDAISFAPGRPYEGFFETSQVFDYLKAYTEYLADDLGYTESQVRTNIFQYGRTNGHIHGLIARTVANDEGIEVDPQAVVVTVGCQEGMLLTLRALFAGPDDVLLVSSPCYVGITGTATVLDIPIHPVPEGPHGVDPAAVAAAAAEVRAAGKRPRAMYLVPDFANPSGSSMPVSAREELLRVAEREDLLLLEDNPYGFFLREGNPRPTLKALDRGKRVIYLGSFAKTGFPGARVGYVLADQPVLAPDGSTGLLADSLSKIKSMTTVNTAALSQAAIGGMLIQADCRLRDANSQAIAFYRNNLQTVLDQLEHHFPADVRANLGISWNAPEGGFFLVVTVPFTADDTALNRAARDYGVLWTPMNYFHHDNAGDHQLRLSCSALDPDTIVEGMTRLATFIKDTIQS
ncbi:(S)-3,5-dihydroxyphenylglycine transaminase [Actinokineospora baliensis]|uniref:aminotransferase-like domain-containing protein n=1 Tax=Actinokineospora baliensis TaxID=547056 RepID=UPI0027DBDA7C|nr:PLP-dependent aminotransferase family protein [Actinokineospora baliensis]MBM7772926.1 (S)-3,5-dihydroxyphenylglycine transaminase [Actinokineospora baliensis]